MATITGTQGDDPLLDGTEEDDEIFGLGGEDTIFGNGGNDRILGGRQNDELRGGEGIDTLIGGPGKDRLFGGNQGDTLEGGSGEDVLRGGLGNDTLRGGDQKDNLFGQGGDDELFGGRGPDHLDGHAGDDMLFGDAGDDTLVGRGTGTGTDTLAGGDDDDTYQLHGAQHQLVEIAEGGFDTVEAYVDYTLPENIERLELEGDARVGIGNDDANRIDGNALANQLEGGKGRDRLLGGEGGDRLEGGKQNDTLEGGKGVDQLFGGRHDDTLIGGRGDDILTGGAGTDRFVIERLADGGDTIRDFRPEQGDVLDLSQLLTRMGPGDDLADFVQVSIERGSTLVGVDINGRGENFKQIAVLEGIELESLSRAQLGLPPAVPDDEHALSRTPDGEAEGDGDSLALSISADGRLVVLASDANNLSDRDGPRRDIFLVDVGQDTRAPIAEAAASLFGQAEISEDGRYVVMATNDPRITEDGAIELVRLELETGRVVRIPTTADEPVVSDITPTGRFVTYSDTGADGRLGLFRWDGLLEESVRVDGPAPGSGRGSMSRDGNLVAIAGEGVVKNIATGEIVVSNEDINFFFDEGFVTPAGNLSGDGQHVFFNSAVALLDSHVDVWVFDIATGETEEVSTNAAGVSGNSDSRYLGASDNGRFVALLSRASNLVDGDDENSFDLFVKDLLTGEIVRVAEGAATGTISADGSAVTYSVRGENGDLQAFWAPTGFEGGDLGAQAAGDGLPSLSLEPLLVDAPDLA